jgi:hypothetical protein
MDRPSASEGDPLPQPDDLPRWGGKTTTAILQKIEFNPVLSEDRFKILAVAT